MTEPPRCPCIVHFRWVSNMVPELYLSNTVTKREDVLFRTKSDSLMRKKRKKRKERKKERIREAPADRPKWEWIFIRQERGSEQELTYIKLLTV